ncbi:MAG: serine/threonine protein kinase [Deltaproteobacteria bacterium]|nr:serine/threonine protein kinase [Deltaproteobacteria bacterium]MDQ3299530.1 serine/threonine protein kinase [Myxococcota bacterium]
MPEEDDTKPFARRTRKERGQLIASELGKPIPIDALIGQVVLDRYVIESELGAGAMGAVYKGRHHKLKRVVAIKVLHEHLTHEPTMLARFRREAHIAAKLQHPNVISVLDVGETASGLQVMVMEYAQGPTLTEVMTVSPARRRMIQLLHQLLLGLDHAHGVGLIHRDLKPDNIIVAIGDDGTEIARIVDFGIAILRVPDESGEGGRLTASGMMLGTPLYMSPEQAQCEPIDHRADLFSLGVILYEMLAGVTPFEGTAMEIAVANISRDPPSIAQRSPGREVDPLLELYARKLMARKPDRRFSSAREALDVLDLIERDPAEASLWLGKTDVPRALEMISLPELKKR